MDKKYHQNNAETEQSIDPEANENVEINDVEELNDEYDQPVDAEMAEMSEEESLRKQLEETTTQLEKEKKEYLFLMAEFDNFRKRTLKEKSELIKNGGESALRGLLPIIDDFERSLQAINENSDPSSIKEGVELIYNKFVKYLEQNGVKAIDTAPGTNFDTEMHEAVTMFPAPTPEQKGKIIDTIQKGYTLHDKVLRHAKVVVGQ
ncbi:MAG: nucleotide exchange factor GrpE [Muribaculum sp.]|nr:nucleotide exchange factor GrpE [Muribaculaceae bacterium]MCM1081389.1 nucleotide exchange factor GrpE [Muribaculum sp.]